MSLRFRYQDSLQWYTVVLYDNLLRTSFDREAGRTVSACEEPVTWQHSLIRLPSSTSF
jgi:hypothetical protein